MEMQTTEQIKQTAPVNRVKPTINFIRVQHETWPTPKRRVGLVASVYICQGDRWLTIRDNGNITGHWRSMYGRDADSIKKNKIFFLVHALSKCSSVN